MTFVFNQSINIKLRAFEKTNSLLTNGFFNVNIRALLPVFIVFKSTYVDNREICFAVFSTFFLHSVADHEKLKNHLFRITNDRIVKINKLFGGLYLKMTALRNNFKL